MDHYKYNPDKDLEQERLEQEWQDRLDDRAIENQITARQELLLRRRYTRSYQAST